MFRGGQIFNKEKSFLSIDKLKTSNLGINIVVHAKLISTEDCYSTNGWDYPDFGYNFDHIEWERWDVFFKKKKNKN